jgi:hypothetical protein
MTVAQVVLLVAAVALGSFAALRGKWLVVLAMGLVGAAQVLLLL